MRDLVRKIISRNNQSQSSDDIDTLSSSDSPPPSPPPDRASPLPRAAEEERKSPLVASSDADTVEPEHYVPPTPPPAPVRTATNTRCSPQRTECTTKARGVYDSPSSSASTVPPPSPGVLARFQLASSVPAQHAVIVEVDERGIEGYEEDEGTREAMRDVGCKYPKLEKGRFRFVEEGEVQEMQLSDRGGDGILPVEIVRCLSKYQRDGVTFMYRLWERRRGGLLADAMGLGKTVQTLCFLGAAFGVWKTGWKGDARILVVAPASVGENWKKEIQVWTPFKVALYKSQEEGIIGRGLKNGDVNIVVAGEVPVGKDGGSTWFRRPYSAMNFEWDVVIVDEIHVAKNKSTSIYKALRRLPKRAMFGLTGTAVQNNLVELWNILSLVVPDEFLIDEKTFRRELVDIVNRGTKRDASEYMQRKASDKIRVLRNWLAKHVLRRPKSIIESHLPGKTDYCVLMRMKKDGLQGRMYQRFQNSYDVRLLRDAREPCDCGSQLFSKECCHRFPNTEEHLRNAPIWKMHHKDLRPCERCPNCICLLIQHYARLLSAHALMILPEENEADKEKAKCRRKLFSYYLGDQVHRAQEPLHILEQDADISCKLNVALRLLKSYEKSGHKTIIFYESLRLGEILRHWATNKGLMHEVIDGTVHKGERQGAVDRFNTNSGVSTFFISKRAGGTGLNICGADRVLIFEPCWNPTLDLQAGDRAHRLGQKRVVQIIRLVVENTVEHYVFKTAIRKSQVSSAILDNTREEWRIREDEIGSMRAMLRMGNVFAEPQAPQDEFQVIKATELIGGEEVSPLFSAESRQLESSKDSEDDNPNKPHNNVDVFGNNVIGSLQVDIESDPWLLPNDESTDERKEEKLHADEHIQVQDSQMETDMLLEEGGASGKLVVASTSARKRKRQLMGANATQRDSGINPDGVNGVNFDDASLGMAPLSEEEDEVFEGDDGSVKRGRYRLRTSSSKRIKRPRVVATLTRKHGCQETRKADDIVIQLSDESEDSVDVVRRRRIEKKSDESSRRKATRKEIVREPKRKESLRRSELQPPIQMRPLASMDRTTRRVKRPPPEKSSKATIEKPVAQRSAFAARARVRK